MRRGFILHGFKLTLLSTTTKTAQYLGIPKRWAVFALPDSHKHKFTTLVVIRFDMSIDISFHFFVSRQKTNPLPVSCFTKNCDKSSSCLRCWIAKNSLSKSRKSILFTYTEELMCFSILLKCFNLFFQRCFVELWCRI